jgi:hypothetical protein
MDDMVLALVALAMFPEGSGVRAWKCHNRDAMERLHERGYISDQKSKAKLVVMTEEGGRRPRCSHSTSAGRREVDTIPKPDSLRGPVHHPAANQNRTEIEQCTGCPRAVRTLSEASSMPSANHIICVTGSGLSLPPVGPHPALPRREQSR